MKKYILTLLVLALGLYGCTGGKRLDAGISVTNWAGTYAGVLPCADCEGIRTVLTLETDQTYTLTSTYLGKNDETFEEKGRFVWKEKDRILELRGDDQAFLCRIGENTLAMLDGDGQDITGPLAEMYVLRKQVRLSSPVQGVRWKLVELMGQPVSAAPDATPYIHLNPEDGSFSGFAGCNLTHGSYALNAENHIRFTNISSTCSACPNMDNEEKFFTALSKAETYVCDGQTMTLHTSADVLAKFTSLSGQ